VSQRLETQGQSIFFVAKVDKSGPAYHAGMRPEDMLLTVDGQRVKTWDDAARLVLGVVGTGCAVGWHSHALGQHKSARLRRVIASPFDLEILVCQQRQRRQGSTRGSSKGVFSQASAGWKWLKKQASMESSTSNRHPENSSQSGSSRDFRSERCSQRGGDRSGDEDSSRRDVGPRGSIRVETNDAKSAGSERLNDKVASVGTKIEVQVDGQGGDDDVTCAPRSRMASVNGSARGDQGQQIGLPPSPLTHNAVAMWTDSWQEGREGGGGGEMASHERVVMNGYLRHAVDLARQGCARGSDGASALTLESSLARQDSDVTSAQDSRSEGSVLEDDSGSESGSSRRGWKDKVKKAVGRVVKEVSVVMGTEKHQVLAHFLSLVRACCPWCLVQGALCCDALSSSRIVGLATWGKRLPRGAPAAETLSRTSATKE